MARSKHIDILCCLAMALGLLLTALLMAGARVNGAVATRAMGYEERLFDTSRVHTVDIVMDRADWENFLSTATEEEYVACKLVIDGESYKNVALRAKGNTSLSNVQAYGNDRYSFKAEFDRYVEGNSYHGLDKLVLNNCIQDNTYMKDYLVYRMMAGMGVDAPLVSYAWVTVNGEDWGLYLALEAVEDSFLERNYGGDYGELYKPDSMRMGGGRGNGRDFDMEDFAQGLEEGGDGARPEPPDMAGGPGNMGGDDVSLVYTDDAYTSYANIFESAKTDITNADRDRLIASLKKLNAGEDIESVVDVESVLRYLVVHNFVVNFDSYTGSMVHNYYLYERDGKISMIPWDYNLAFGAFSMGAGTDATAMVNYPIDTPVSGGTMESRPLVNALLTSPEYLTQYQAYFSEFLAMYFENGAFEALLEETRTLIAPYVEKDPTAFCTYAEFEAGADTLARFCALRAESVSGQLGGSIPATTEGQSAEASALVDASSVSLAAMGSFSGGGQMGGPGQMPGGMGGPPDFAGSDGWIQGGPPTGMGGPPDFAGSDGRMQGGPPGQGGPMGGGMGEASAAATKNWLYLGVLLLLLPCGICFAALYKRRGRESL